MAFIGGAITNPATTSGLHLQQLHDVAFMRNMMLITGEYKFRPTIALIFGYPLRGSIIASS